MKIITIKQPFATLIAEGYKEYEFRSWKTKYRGEVLIHAGKGVDTKAMKRFEYLGLTYPVSTIVAKCIITDCVEVTKKFKDLLKDKDPVVYYGILNDKRDHVTYGFKLEEVIKLNIFSVKGQLGLWNYDIK